MELELIMKNDIKNEINFIETLTEIKKSLSVNENNEPKIKINSTKNNDSNEKRNKSNIGKKIKSNKAKIRNKSSN